MSSDTIKKPNQESKEASVKKFTWKSSYTELFFIILGVFLVFLAWIYYPEYISWRDNHQSEETTQFIIPYQIDAMLKTEPEPVEAVEEEKTKFQQVGDLYGTYGDSYGSLNTLFSGLAFTFLVASLFLQRKELQEQREEISRSNDIADEQRQIAANQEILISNQLSEGQKQNFYNLLFKFLDEKKDRFSRLTIRSKRIGTTTDSVGDSFMKVFSRNLSSSIQTDFIDLNEDELKVILKTELEKIYTQKTYSASASFEDYSYFEYLMSILKFMQKNSIYNQDGSITEIFLSTLTMHETLCMAYYAVIKDQTSLKQYIEEFSLLRHLDSFEMAGSSMENLKVLFAEKAFIVPKKATLDDIFVDLK